jgi:hypothetical protein
MKRLFIDRRRSTMAGAAAILAILGATLLLVKPRVGHAFTLIELPAVQFGPVDVLPGQDANLCMVNWGDQTLLVIVGIVSASNTNTVLARTETHVAAGSDVCLPFVESIDANGPTTVAGIISVRAAPKTGIDKIGASMQLQDTATQTNRIFIPGNFLPAVQLPSNLSGG